MWENMFSIKNKINTALIILAITISGYIVYKYYSYVQKVGEQRLEISKLNNSIDKLNTRVTDIKSDLDATKSLLKDTEAAFAEFSKMYNRDQLIDKEKESFKIKVSTSTDYNALESELNGGWKCINGSC